MHTFVPCHQQQLSFGNYMDRTQHTSQASAEAQYSLNAPEFRHIHLQTLVIPLTTFNAILIFPFFTSLSLNTEEDA